MPVEEVERTSETILTKELVSSPVVSQDNERAIAAANKIKSNTTTGLSLNENVALSLLESRLVKLEPLRVFALNDYVFDWSKVNQKSLVDVRKKRGYLPAEFTFYAGINFMRNNFKKDVENSDLAATLNNMLSAEIGTNLGLELRWKLNRSIYLSTGIEVVEVENRLDKIISRDTMVHRNNARLGLVRAQQLRTIRNHNKLKFITIPLEIGLTKYLKRFEFGSSIGLSYSILQSQKGKIINKDNEVLVYGNEPLDQVYKGNFFALRLSPYLKYHLTPKIGLSLRTSLSLQTHGQSPALELEHRSGLLMPSLGFTYTY